MDAIDNPSQMAFFPQPTDSSAVGAGSTSPDRLYSDQDLAESIPIIRSFIHSPCRVAVARSLRGKEAQELINFIDQVITLPELDEKLRKQCLHLLYKMCKACETLPASYILRRESISVGSLRCYGGFADVSEGEYLGCRVAIKHLRIGAKDASNKIFKQFCREILYWKQLSHPNILPLLGVSVSANPYHFRIVSAWMQNGNVMEYTRSNPGANRLRMLSDVMSGTTYLHELGVVHGDLKGANILVDDDNTALLADFGLVTISVDLSTLPLSATTVSAAGTVRWMGPELFLGRNSLPTRESDCYALGMVIYELLTGLYPFHRLGPYEVVIAVQNGGRPSQPLNAESLGFSDKLWGLVLQCWDKSPSARPTARQLLRCLQDASHSWVPPLEYPIPDGLDVGAGVDSTSSDEQSMVTRVLTCYLFAFVVGMLCILLPPPT